MDIKSKLKLMREIKAKNEENVKEWKKRMEKKIVGVLVDAENGTVSLVIVNNTLEGLRTALGCDYIEIVHRNIKGKTFTVICDEEGRMKDNQIVTGVIPAPNNRFYAEFVGNIFICSDRVEGEGDLVGLDVFEAVHVISEGRMMTGNGRELIRFDSY